MSAQPSVQSRAGVTLIELLLSLVLLALVIAMAGATLKRILVVEFRATNAASQQTALADALRTLRLHTESASPADGDVIVAADTVLDIRSDFGVTSACRANGDTVVTALDNHAVPWASSLPRQITAGDLVRVWSDSLQAWRVREVKAVASASGACGDSTAAGTGRAGQRLILHDSVPNIVTGAVLRIAQRERWSLVRGGDGRWSLGLALWDAARGASGVPQPLVSGLAKPSSAGAGGMAVRAVDASGATLTAAELHRTRSIFVALRSETQPRVPQSADSVRINVGAH
jgi:type II secretory pathway pseudopilin PulG